MLPPLSPRLLAAFAALAALPAARADFSGAYDVGTPGSYNLVSGQTTAFGTWSAILNTSGSYGGSGSVSTTSAPGSLTLYTIGNPGFGGGGQGTGSVSFTHDGFASAGTVSFSFSATGAGSFSVTLDGDAQTPVDSIYSFEVTPDSVLVFSVTATGTPGSYTPGFPPTYTPTFFPGGPGDINVTISDFSAPAAVPEPASVAALAGLGALGLASLRRRHRAT